MTPQEWEDRICKLEYFTTKPKLIFSRPAMKKMVSQMRELWEMVKASKDSDGHHIAMASGGNGIEGWIMPVCTCGWQGHQHYAHNDYQHSNAREEGEDHLKSVNPLGKDPTHGYPC